MEETSQDPLTTKYFQLEQVADGVHAAIESPGSGAIGNAGFVDLGDRVLVFDTFRSPRAAADLRGIIEHLYGRRVAAVVNSHWHADHVFGNQVFADTAIIATAETRELIAARGAATIEYARTEGEAYLQSLEAQLEQEQNESARRALALRLSADRELVATLPTLTLTLPNETFERRLTFHGPARTAELLTFGGGHTASDALLYLPDERLVFIGDLVVTQSHPLLVHGNPEEWIQILDQVEALGVATVVPGHGPVGTVEDLALVRQYITELLSLATEAAETGQSADELAGAAIPAPFATWGFSANFVRNLRFLHERLSNR